MKSAQWNKVMSDRTSSLLRWMTTILFLVSITCGFLAFNDHTMNLKLAFYALMGVLVVIALK